jgi:hypothetical protein
MARQCPGCNKLAGLETDESPEVDLRLDGTNISATMRLVRLSSCCNEEMKEANFEPDMELDAADLEGHYDFEKGDAVEGHDLDIEETGVEVTERSEGKGRGCRTFYGIKVSYDIVCSCTSDKPVYTGTLADECQASSMDELT